MTTISGSAPRVAVFLRVATDPVIALWLGFADIDVPINALDVAGETYQGLGALVGVPQLQQLLNGVAQRADFALSGVSAAVASMAQSEAEDVIGSTVNVGTSMMDDDWQLEGDVLWLWEGRADVLTTSMQGQSDGSQAFAIQLSVGTANAGRAHAEYATWSDAQHQRAHPGDLFFSHVPPPEKTKRWPGG